MKNKIMFQTTNQFCWWRICGVSTHALGWSASDMIRCWPAIFSPHREVNMEVSNMPRSSFYRHSVLWVLLVVSHSCFFVGLFQVNETSICETVAACDEVPPTQTTPAPFGPFGPFHAKVPSEDRLSNKWCSDSRPWMQYRPGSPPDHQDNLCWIAELIRHSSWGCCFFRNTVVHPPWTRVCTDFSRCFVWGSSTHAKQSLWWWPCGHHGDSLIHLSGWFLRK